MEIYNFFTNGHSSSKSAKKDFTELPFSSKNVWILGKLYHATHDLEQLRAAVRSKLWFSYRTGFSSIGGTGPKTDRFWGCMLRCGQMVMAEALICRHLGRGWLWNPSAIDPVYSQILKMFQDKKDSPYSIHQIAQMGVSEGKAIGQWFGPNTVAQVLRKLSVYDEWSSIAVHVACDSAVIKSDIVTLCHHRPDPCTSPNPFGKPYQTKWYTETPRLYPRIPVLLDTMAESSSYWRPMLLFIPLRLGLNSFNPIYTKSLKNVFKMKQSLGIIGGRPRHAVWFIGCTGEELICLDPHNIQSTVNLDCGPFDDSSFHLPVGGSKRMQISNLDPSIALCFFIQSEEDFENWCQIVSELLVVPENQHLFELLPDRPTHWPPLELRPDLNCSNCSLDYFFVEQDNKGDLSDEDFESIEAIVCHSKDPRL